MVFPWLFYQKYSYSVYKVLMEMVNSESSTLNISFDGIIRLSQFQYLLLLALGQPTEAVVPLFDVNFENQIFLDNAYASCYSKRFNLRIGKQANKSSIILFLIIAFYKCNNESNDKGDLRRKINELKKFHNFIWPHKSHGGLTPYEIFRVKMDIDIQGQPKFEV